MLNHIKNAANRTLTENGAATYRTTGSECLDLFAAVGGLRCRSEREILARFVRAYTEDPDLSMKMLFFVRDVRGGLGERRVFRVIFRYLACNEPESVRRNLRRVPIYGRFDDLFALMGTPCEKDALDFLHDRFKKDLLAMQQGRSVSLLAKWLPSVNASNPETKLLGKKCARAFGLSDAEYRKSLSALRAAIRILENNLREKDYSFDYTQQPSRAVLKYREAFRRNDRERYFTFLDDVAAGRVKMHACNIVPYELVAPYLITSWYAATDGFMKDISPDEKKVLNATWDSLPDYGNDENVLAVVDTSGSMYDMHKPLPAAVALSLGLYFAERNTGAFRNHFIEFSAEPQLIEIKGETFADRLRYVCSFNKVANTNLEAVFDLILHAAVENRVPQNELPSKLIFISDMEFDRCVSDASETNFRNAQKKFASHGYALPQIVFWNANSKRRQQPVRMNEQGVALVSGVTPRIFSFITGDIVTPYAFMMDVLGNKRYAKIAA